MALVRSTPSEVLDGVYVGSKWHLSPRILKQLHITWILNVWRSGSSPKVAPEKFLCHPLSDYGDDALVNEYAECVGHIARAREAKEAILVHCEGGINRSTTVTIIYMVAREGYTLRDASILMKKRREHARPHEGYLRQLPLLEEKLRGSQSISVEELVGLFQPVTMHNFAPCATLSDELWARLLADYKGGTLMENIQDVTPADRMQILNVCLRLQAVIEATG